MKKKVDAKNATAEAKAKEEELEKKLALREQEQIKMKQTIVTLEEQVVNQRHNLNMKYSLGITDNKQFILEWISAYYELIENAKLAGKDYKTVLTQRQQQLLEVNLIRKTWKISFHQHFVSKLHKMTIDKIYCVIHQIQSAAEGHFLGYQRIPSEAASANLLSEFMINKSDSSQIIVILASFVQIPITRLGTELQVQKFEFIQELHFLNVFSQKDYIDNDQINAKYSNIFKDPCRGYKEIAQLKLSAQKYKYNQSKTLTLFNCTLENLKGNSILPKDGKELQSNGEKYFGCEFEDHYLSYEESQQLVYNESISRWVHKEKQELEKQFRLKEEIAQQNKYMIQTFADFKSASNLVEMLQKIPNLKLKLTDEEIDVIGQPGNTMVIGRSGTGKTTCAMLRLFAMEIIFHLRVQMYLKKHGQNALMDASSSKDIGLQSVFITASPVLANQIKRYYTKLTNDVKEEIKRKQQLKQAEEAAQRADGTTLTNESVSIVKTKPEGGESDELSMEENLTEIITSNMINASSATADENTYMEDDFEDDNLNDRFVFKEDTSRSKRSLKDLERCDFPSFQTVRSYILLIEGCLNKPFFDRTRDGRLSGQQGFSSWNQIRSIKQQEEDECEGSEAGDDQNQEDKKREEFMDYGENEDLEEIYRREMYLQSHRNAESKIPRVDLIKPKDRQFEVDFTYFSNAFYPIASAKFKGSNQVSCSILWTEIYSYIKGSATSFNFPERCQSREHYVKTEQNPLLSEEQRGIVYSMFEYYENWKNQQYGYDLMDAVNYLLVEISNKRCDLPSIHFTMIDEVQDLPYAVVTLFAVVNEQNLFIAGDTAQTIARGVGFRFNDMKVAFKNHAHVFEKPIEDPVIRQLTVNFRSHNRILQLSNSVISLIEGLFPTSIDILKKERSNIDGMKPIVIADNDLGFLFHLLSGQQSEEGQVPLEFGCNQVIIVKDEDSKKKLPHILQHAICLTIYEAKGLEFDDVILFDFFMDSKSPMNSWGSIGLFDMQVESMDKELFLRMMTMHDSVFEEASRKDISSVDFESAYGVTFDEASNQVKVMNVITKTEQLRAFNRIENALLCSELKQLYTAVTRPKKRLIIFDQEKSKRKSIESFWSRQNLVTILTQSEVYPESATSTDSSTASTSTSSVKTAGSSTGSSASHENPAQLERDYQANKEFLQNQKRDKEAIVENVKKLLVKNSAEEWQEQGVKMFKYKYFEQAVKCFKKSGDVTFEKRAQAYLDASTTASELLRIENEIELHKKKIGQYAMLRETARSAAIAGLTKQIQPLKKKFEEIGDQFLSIRRVKQAAQCYFSAENYLKAANLYIELNMSIEAAEAFALLGNSAEKAAALFESAQLYEKAITCLESAGNHIEILALLARNQNAFESWKYESLRDTHASNALSTVLLDLETQKNNLPEKIVEEAEDDDESSTSKIIPDDVSISVSDVLQVDNTSSNQEQQQEEQEEEEEEVKNEEQNEIIKQSDIISLGFDEMSSFDDGVDWLGLESNANGVSASDIEVLSKQEGGESILRRIQSMSSFSEYSAIDASFVEGNDFVREIKTKQDTNLPDEYTEKIFAVINITQERSGDFDRKFFEDATADKTSKLPHVTLLDSMNETDRRTMVDIAVDFLSSHSHPKLSLLLSNRYSNFHRISDLVVSLALKYSPMSKQSFKANVQHFTNTIQASAKKEKNAATVAAAALHSIFEQIDPSFLRATAGGDQNDRFSRALLMLGYWKRILFLLKREEALGVAETFGDYRAITQILGTSQEPADLNAFAIHGLQSYLINLMSAKKDSSSVTHACPAIPSACKFNLFFNKKVIAGNGNKKGKEDASSKSQEAEKEIFEQFLVTLERTFTVKEEKNAREDESPSVLEIFDAVSALSMLIQRADSISKLVPQIPSEEDNGTYYRRFSAVCHSLKKFIDSNQIALDYYHSNVILKAILTPQCVRTIPVSPKRSILSIYSSSQVCFSKYDAPNLAISLSKLMPYRGLLFCDIELTNVLAPLEGLLNLLSKQYANKIGVIGKELEVSSLFSLASINPTDKDSLKNTMQVLQSESNGSADVLNLKLQIQLKQGDSEGYLNRMMKQLKSNSGFFNTKINQIMFIAVIANQNQGEIFDLTMPTEFEAVLNSILDLQLVEKKKVKGNETEAYEEEENPIEFTMDQYDNSADISDIVRQISIQIKTCDKSKQVAKRFIPIAMFAILNLYDVSNATLTTLISILWHFQSVFPDLYQTDEMERMKLFKDIDDLRENALNLTDNDEFTSIFGYWNTSPISCKECDNHMDISSDEDQANPTIAADKKKQKKKSIDVTPADWFLNELRELVDENVSSKYFGTLATILVEKPEIKVALLKILKIRVELLDEFSISKELQEESLGYLLKRQGKCITLLYELVDFLKVAVEERMQSNSISIQALANVGATVARITSFKHVEKFKIWREYNQTSKKITKRQVAQSAVNLQNQKIQLLLKKRANILKQKRMVELKAIQKLMSRK